MINLADDQCILTLEARFVGGGGLDTGLPLQFNTFNLERPMV
mgnify:CR=1 FL=1